LLAVTGEDSDRRVNEMLTRLSAAFLDQGFAPFPLPHREAGIYRAFCELYRAGSAPAHWLRGMPQTLQRLVDGSVSPLASIAQSLELLGVREEEREAFISATLLALRGWGGMIWQMETRSDRAAIPAPPNSLVEFLAVRLILERFSLADVARIELGYSGPLAELRIAARAQVHRPEATSVDQRAFLIFQVAQALQWLPEDLFRLTVHDWTLLVGEIEAFTGLERQRLFQLAFERRYCNQALDAIANHQRYVTDGTQPPKFQLMTCIDDREESFRRHVEEILPGAETYSLAGFYGVAMYYRGAADDH
jgi:uncharacterized protein YbcC (UPF0753/DUF2309 family)